MIIELLKPLGEKVSNIFTILLTKLAEYNLTISSKPLTSKIISILVFLIIGYFSLKITQKVVKFLIIILSILLLSSVIVTFLG